MVFSSKPLPLSAPYTSHLTRIRTNTTSPLSFSPKRSRPTFPKSISLTSSSTTFISGCSLCASFSCSATSRNAQNGLHTRIHAFGFVTIYMTVAAFLLAYSCIESVAQSEGRDFASISIRCRRVGHRKELIWSWCCKTLTGICSSDDDQNGVLRVDLVTAQPLGKSRSVD
jgi:hypothetical protein